MVNKEIGILEKYGAADIKSYCLISNYGYTFTIKGVKYDIRFWENCYGSYIGKWSIHPAGNFTEIDKELVHKIEAEFNA